MEGHFLIPIFLILGLSVIFTLLVLPEPVSVPLSAVTSVERESDGVVKTEERNLCFTRDEDEKKDDDVSVYCVQAQGSLVCWVAACGRDTVTLCSTYYTICVLIYGTGTLQHSVLLIYTKGRSHFKKTVKKRGHCPLVGGGGQPQFLF